MIKLDELGMVHPNGFVGLHSASLTLDKGQLTVLLGQSYAGKSILTRCLNFLNRLTNGVRKVYAAGVIKPGPTLPDHRRRTDIAFQLHQLIGRHSALKNVLVGRLGLHIPLL